MKIVLCNHCHFIGSPRQVMYLSPPNPGSNYRSRERKKPQEPKCEQLQNILDNLPSPARQYRVSRSVGSGTFSTVFR